MARSHLDEEVRSELAQDFEGVVPADRMRDARREILPNGFGVVESATASIAHIRRRRRPQSEPRHVTLETIRDRLKQRAMRRDADRQTLDTVRTLLASLYRHRIDARSLPATTIWRGALKLEM